VLCLNCIYLYIKLSIIIIQQDRYDEAFAKSVYGAPLMTLSQLSSGKKLDISIAVRVEYTNKESFKGLAKSLGIMDDLKVNNMFNMFHLFYIVC